MYAGIGVMLYDAATGMYNYGCRGCTPEAARFTTADPIREGSNRFAYVNNDTVNRIDPWGHDILNVDEIAEGEKKR
jgi:RHS repeat-associated protein